MRRFGERVSRRRGLPPWAGLALAFLVAGAGLAGRAAATPATVTVGPFDVTFYNSGDSYFDGSTTYTGAKNWTPTEMDDIAASIQVYDNRIDNPAGPRQVKLYVLWANLGSTTLGSSYNPMRYSYPSAWTDTEALWRQGMSFSYSYADAFIEFSTGVAWHTGSSSPGGSEIDFRSVAAHELGHALGFDGTYSSLSHRWSSSGITEWDERLRDAATGGNQPAPGSTGTPKNFNETANPDYWEGTYAKAANGGNRLAVYGPSSFEGGSSLYHVDDSTYPNALMKHAIAYGAMIREPTALEWEIFKDLGWSIITTKTWSKGGGTLNWGDAGNWNLGGVPDITNRVTFANTGLAAGNTVSLGVSRTVDAITFDSTVTFTVGGTGGTLTLQKGNLTRTAASAGTQTLARPVALVASGTWDVAGSGQLVVSGMLDNSSGKTLTKTGAGTLTLSGTQTNGVGAGLAVGGGTVNLNQDGGGSGTPAYNLTVSVTASGAAVNFGASQHLKALALSDGTAALTAGGGKVLTTKSLSIAAPARLDLMDNDVVVDYSGTTDPVATIRGYLATGCHGGAWDGLGITSAAAKADRLASPLVPTALGYRDDTTAKKVTVKYTWLGDSDLDGVVDIADDYFAFLDGLNGVGTSWYYGDYNYDGVVDIANDYFAFLDGFNMQTGQLGGVEAGPIPEPASALLMGVGAILVTLRRKRR